MITPNYYKGKHYGMEAHEVIEDFCGDNYNVGVAVAYLLRAGKKPDNDMCKDLEKAIDHLKFELKRQRHLEVQKQISEEQAEINRINDKFFNCAISTY